MRGVIALLVALLSACDPHPGCDVAEVEAALARVSERLPEVADIAGRMQVFCLADTTRMCASDVDACMLGVGMQARMAVRTDVPVANAIAHEAVHWWLWDVDPCRSHSPSCGWDAQLVEDLQ